MKTPTLIVRLVGLYLLANSAITLVQIHAIQSMGPIGATQQSTVGNIETYAILGLIAGISATVFAGPLACLLTFDAKPRTSQTEITERLLQRKS